MSSCKCASLNYYAQIGKKYANHNAEHQRELGYAVYEWQNWVGGPDAAPIQVQRRGRQNRDRLFRENVLLVVKFASKHSYLVERQSYGCMDDFVQMLVTGLTRGIERFNPYRVTRLSTICYWWMYQAFTRYMALCKTPCHVPHNVITLQAAIIKGTKKLEDLKPNDRARVEASQRMMCCASLDFVITDDGGTLVETVAAPVREDLVELLSGIHPDDLAVLTEAYLGENKAAQNADTVRESLMRARVAVAA